MGFIIQNREISSPVGRLDKQIRLHSEDLVIDVIGTMLRQELYTMPVFYYNKQIGVIRFKDIISFLTHRELGENLIYHKLNYNIESVLKMIGQKSNLTYIS
nr:hypothetical protein [Pedobacter panaciterrae]